MGSQSLNANPHVDYYLDLWKKNEHNIIAIPFDNDGTEPGDDYEIMAYYENILGFKFYVVEKIDVTHKFFKDFGEPTTDFTEYHFDNKTKFVRKV
jgi:glutathione peroxidase-family protein